MTIKPGDRLAYRKDPFTEVETHVWPNGHMHSYNVRTKVIHVHGPNGTLLHSGKKTNPLTLVPLQERVEVWAAVTPDKVILIYQERSDAEKTAKARGGRLVCLREAPYLREVPEAEE